MQTTWEISVFSDRNVIKSSYFENTNENTQNTNENTVKKIAKDAKKKSENNPI